MDVKRPLQLLGGISPAQFMRQFWHKKPLLVRQAVPGFAPHLDRNQLFALARDPGVASRLVWGTIGGAAGSWKMRQGPFSRRSLPPRSRAGWTLLVQSVDLFVDEVHALREQFRFVPDARLDDVMVSFATDAGGVGPHFDSYDVFLLQASGRRRWRISAQNDLSLHDGLPLKVLRNFTPDAQYLLAPGDMLYLPPRIAHEGVAVGECMTWSIGFRAPDSGNIAAELLQRLATDVADVPRPRRYRDPRQSAVATPARVPPQLAKFASVAVRAALSDPQAIARALGESLTEPAPLAWFQPGVPVAQPAAVALDHKTKMLYDEHHVFINGESFLASGRDAELMRLLADARRLPASALTRASRQAQSLVAEWRVAGWVHGV